MKIFIRNGNKLLKFDANERQVKQVLSILSKPDAGLTLPRIARAVSMVTGVKNIGEKDGSREIVNARYSYFYLSRKHTDHTLKDIGSHIGDFRHTNVSQGFNKIDEFLSIKHPVFIDLIANAEKYLGI